MKTVLQSVLTLIILLFTFSAFALTNKAYATDWKVCPEGDTSIGCSHFGAQGIQEAIRESKNGDMILIKPGANYSYTWDGTVPFNNAPLRVATDKCMINLEGKSLTLKGDGGMPVIFGKGHAPGYADVEPYAERQGLCSSGGLLTIDNLKIKEFQKRCIAVYNTQLILKNSIIEGCDEGGVSIGGNSGALIANNQFVSMNIGGVLLWNNAQAKIVNNTFYEDGIMFFYHPGTDDKIHAEIVNNIFDSPNNFRLSIAQVDWWTGELDKLKTNTYRYNLVWKHNTDYAANEYRDDYVGKISADPLFANSGCIDMTGLNWCDLSLQGDSPVIGKGDPSIPGPKNIGAGGGPCANSASEDCFQFIHANQPQLYQPPQQPPVNPPPVNNPPQNPQNTPANPQPQSNPFGLNILLPTFISKINIYGESQKKTDDGMSLFMFILFSGVYIMFIHFAVAIKDFNLFLMIVYFVIGGVVGLWFHSWEFGLVLSIILSLIFI